MFKVNVQNKLKLQITRKKHTMYASYRSGDKLVKAQMSRKTPPLFPTS